MFETIVDFETTGLLNDQSIDFLKQPGIVQIGAVKLDIKTREEIGHLSTLVNPDIAAAAWEEGAMKTTGITPEQVADSPTLLGFFPTLAEFIRGSTCWIGYNTKFDKRVLWHQLLKYGYETHFPWPPTELDVMYLVSAKLGKKRRWKLTEAYREIMGKEYAGAHDGLADCRATGDLLRAVS